MLDAKLVVVGGDAKSGEVRLKLPTVIGRGKEAGLTVPHALVSRRHSEIFERDGRLVVRDLGSLNGTFVNNTRIEGEQILEPNQLLTLGNITFRAVYTIASDTGEIHSNQETVTFEEATTESVPDSPSRRSTPQIARGESDLQPLVETVPVDSLETDSGQRIEQSARQNTPTEPVHSPGQSTPVSTTNQPNLRSTGKLDFDSDIFSLDTGQEKPGSVSVSSIECLQTDDPQASFVDQVDLGSSVSRHQEAGDSFAIDIGESAESVDEDDSRLNSFLKKLEQ